MSKTPRIQRPINDEVLSEQDEQRFHAQRLEAIGRLAGGVAHDFNNLLTAIIGNSDLLLRELEDNSATNRVEEIRKAAWSAASLTRQLLVCLPITKSGWKIVGSLWFWLLPSHSHESCPIVVSFYDALVFPDTSKYANRDSCFATSARCAAAADEQACPSLRTADRLLWVILSRVWAQWRRTLVIVKPETVIAWQRKGFRLYWRWKSRGGKCGRSSVSLEIRELIRQMSTANPLWGAPRIHGELLKLGIQISQATVAKYMVRQRKPPSQTWRTFLENHVQQLVAIDFLVVPTVSFRLLFVFVVLGHHRRHAIHFNVTAHPTAEWTGRQIAEAFPWDSAPRYLLHDRDSIYGAAFHQRVGEMDIREVLTAPRSPWQNPYAERFIGSLRRECLDHIIIFNESSLRHILKAYFEYYETSRTHLALEKDAPKSRTIQPRETGIVVELLQVGGLHHRYERRAA